MKTAIVYATKYSCTKECAEILKTYLHGEVNILSAKADKINLSQYDAVFIGGSVYMGKIQKAVSYTHLLPVTWELLAKKMLLNFQHYFLD